MDQLVVNIPIAAAVLGGVKLGLDFYSKERDKDRAENLANRQMWENHLSNTVRVLTELVDQIKELRMDR